MFSAAALLSRGTMAWHSHGRTNTELVNNLRSHGILATGRVVDALLRVDRADFCAPGGAPYQDAPQLIGYGATISAPHMHAVST